MATEDDVCSIASGESFLLDEDLDLFSDEDMVPEEDGTATKGKKGRSLRQSLVRCHICHRGLNTIDGYKNHLKLHIAEELFKSAPGGDAIREECRTQAREIIVSMEKLISTDEQWGLCTGAHGLLINLKELDEDVFFIFVDCASDVITESIPPASSTTLAAFHSAYALSMNRLVVNTEKLAVIYQVLRDIVTCEVQSEVLSWFTGDFLSRLMSKTENFFYKCIREPREVLLQDTLPVQSSKVRDDMDDPMFQSSIYYVGGSAVKSILRLGQSSNSPQWNTVVSCIKNKLLAGPLTSAPAADVIAWTDSVNRGGLQFISGTVWTFLMALSGLLCKIEEKDGSVKHEKVITSVKEDDIIMMLWSEVVEDILSTEDSMFLLTKLCYYFVNAWGRGVALRHKNAIPRLSRDKVALRPSLLSRK